MAKGKRTKLFHMAGDEEIKVEDTFTTSTGHKLKLQPVSPTLLQLLDQSIPVPEQPYYEGETAFGTVERFPHDATTVETEEEKHKWKEFVSARYNRNVELSAKGNRVILSKGVILPPNVEEKFPEWEEEHRWIGVNVPENPRDKKYHFLTTEIITSPNDITSVIERIMMLMGMDEETLQAAEASFRSQLAT